MRGEDTQTQLPLGTEQGSPPHARGRLRSQYRREGHQGITPACAGKTGLGIWDETGIGDHPRMRGEDWIL